MIRTLDLFSGIGGFAYGLSMTGGFETAAFCEIDPFCRAVLAKHWPGVPIFQDVRNVTAQSLAGLGTIDLICGGFPCQPFSVAGKRKGQADERHLWPEFARLIRELRPRWVLAENVPGLRTTAADEVLSDLEAAGYAAWPLVVGAWAVGAPHKRDRVWVLARRVADADGHQLRLQPGGSGGPDRADSPESRRMRSGMAHPDEQRCGLGPGACSDGRGIGEPADGHLWPAGRGAEQHTWEEPRTVEFEVGRFSDGLPAGLVRTARRRVRQERAANKAALRAYGNSVVPQVVAEFGRLILEANRLTSVPAWASEPAQEAP